MHYLMTLLANMSLTSPPPGCCWFQIFSTYGNYLITSLVFSLCLLFAVMLHDVNLNFSSYYWWCHAGMHQHSQQEKNRALLLSNSLYCSVYFDNRFQQQQDCVENSGTSNWQMNVNADKFILNYLLWTEPPFPFCFEIHAQIFYFE